MYSENSNLTCSKSSSGEILDRFVFFLFPRTVTEESNMIAKRSKQAIVVGSMRNILVARLLKRLFPCSEVSSIKLKVTNSDWRHRHTVICVEVLLTKVSFVFSRFLLQRFLLCFMAMCKTQQESKSQLTRQTASFLTVVFRCVKL